MKNPQINIPEFQDLKECCRLFQTSREAIFVHDYDTGRIVDVNDVMLEMYGYTYDEALHIDPEKVSAGNAPHIIEEANELLNKVKQAGEIAFEWHDVKKNGEFFWTDNVMKVIKLNGQKRIIVISRDVSDRKKKQLRLQSLVRESTEEISALNERLTLANEELRINNEELQEYQNQLEDLVAIRTHELIQSEKSLRYKNRLQQLFTGISTRFFSLSPELVDRNIDSAIKDICQFFDADAGFLVEIAHTGDLYRLTHLWKKATMEWDVRYFKNSPLPDLSLLYEKLKKGESLLITSIDDLPDNLAVRTAFIQSGSGSVVIIPIIYQDILVGIIGIIAKQTGKNLNPDEISLLKAMGETFFNALKRKKFEITLIESERNYREIFNATNEPMFIHDAVTGKILDVNRAAIQLYGFTHEEALTCSADEYSANDSDFNQQTARDQIRQAVENGSVVFEWLARRKNGELFWAEISLKSTEIGGEKRVLAVTRDISETKKNQELLKQSEERFRSIIQYLTDVIWILDEKLNIVFESPSSWQVLGYKPGFLMGKSGIDLIHPDDLRLVNKELRAVFGKRNDFIPAEFRAKHANGNWILLEAIANNMLDHPAIQGIIITCRDITERKQVEKALKISEAKLRNIFNNSSDAIVIVGNNFSFLEVNEVFLKIAGYSLEETKKMNLTDILTDVHIPAFAERLKRFFQHENLPAIECEIICKSQQVLPVEINSNLIEFEGEQALISVIRDITERRLVEKRILDTIINTEEREREKFARNLHDELGPLLSSIKMYVNSLSSNTDELKHDFIMSQLKMILSEAIQSTKELSNDLSPHVLANYGLMAALEWFINQINPYISISLETNIRDERYSNSLESSIYRIIKELINNTIKHAQADKISIKLHYILKSIHLIYSDNGVGFPDSWKGNHEFMGMGMSNIVSRCRSINAGCRFFNHAPKGISFEMEVPVSQS